MTRACVPKDAAALRLWGCVAGEINDTETARAAMNAIVSIESDDLFARLAPLLAMKRAPIESSGSLVAPTAFHLHATQSGTDE